MPRSLFARDYELRIQVGDDQAVIVRPPIRVQFSCDKSIAGGLNRLDISVYNLRESNRLAVAKDPEEQRYIPISFQMGYKDRLEPMFRGSVHTATNRRDGSDIVTEIECIDGGFDYQFAETDRTLAAGADVVDEVLRDMPNTQRGAVARRQRLIRPKVMTGRTPRILDTLIGPAERWFIDNESLNIIGPNQVVGDFVPLISPTTGLLETPEREQRRVTVKTRFNPSVRPGGRFGLESTLAPQMDGVYRAETLQYEGDLDGDAWDQTITGLPVTAPEVVNV